MPHHNPPTHPKKTGRIKTTVLHGLNIVLERVADDKLAVEIHTESLGAVAAQGVRTKQAALIAEERKLAVQRADSYGGDFAEAFAASLEKQLTDQGPISLGRLTHSTHKNRIIIDIDPTGIAQAEREQFFAQSFHKVGDAFDMTLLEMNQFPDFPKWQKEHRSEEVGARK